MEGKECQKLKTLDELLIPSNIDKLNNAEEIILNWSRCELREEAINWIKEMRKSDRDLEGIDFCELSHNNGNVFDADDFIKHFFNIKEEDIQ